MQEFSSNLVPLVQSTHSLNSYFLNLKKTSIEADIALNEVDALLSEAPRPIKDFKLMMNGIDPVKDQPGWYVLFSTQEIRCVKCAGRIDVFYNVKLKQFFVKNDEHKCSADGEFKWTVRFPTGTVIVCDWPILFRTNRDKFYEVFDKDFDINYLSESRRQAEYYGSHKFSFMSTFVGNTCPSFKVNKKKNRISFGSVRQRDGYVCTDLWAATMIDKQTHDEFLKSVDASYDTTHSYGHETLVNVEPGIYEFTNHYELSRYNREDEEPSIMVVGKRIGPC